MFELNPLAQTNAWWQHLVMILGAGILGYIIGYRKSRGIVTQLEGELHDVNVELDDCQSTSLDTIVEKVPASTEVQAVAAVVAPVVEVAVPTKPDNLKLIEGIGPKIEKLLNNDGILTFSQLSQTPVEKIVTILRAAGPRFQMHDPGTWPQQAALAAEDNWDELGKLQSELNKGRSAE